VGKPSYYELLRHPEWQKKRLKIMERDGFCCCDCGATDRTLNVHHSYYLKGHKPWEYEDDALRTLCEDCHLTRHELVDKQIKPDLGLLCQSSVRKVGGYIKGLLLQEVFAEESTEDFESHLGFCHAHEIIDFASQREVARQMESVGSMSEEKLLHIIERSDPITFSMLPLTPHGFLKSLGYAKAVACATHLDFQIMLWNEDEAKGFSDYFGIKNPHNLRLYGRVEQESEDFASVSQEVAINTLAYERSFDDDAGEVDTYQLGLAFEEL
jgi:hypothetical protein